jgi:hypothetical protein
VLLGASPTVAAAAAAGLTPSMRVILKHSSQLLLLIQPFTSVAILLGSLSRSVGEFHYSSVLPVLWRLLGATRDPCLRHLPDPNHPCVATRSRQTDGQDVGRDSNQTSEHAGGV